MSITRTLVAATASALVLAGTTVRASAPVFAEGPTLEEVIAVPSIRSAVISPDGGRVAIVQRRTDWDANRYDDEIHLWTPDGAVQLTDRAGGSSSGPVWSPDSGRLAYIAQDGGPQIFIRDMATGATRQLTRLSGGVSAFKWSPDGRRMALLMDDLPGDAARQPRPDFGPFTLEGQRRDRQHLWLLDVSQALGAPDPASRGAPGLTRLTGGDGFTVGSYFGGDFNFTPDGREILFDHAVSNDPEDIGTQDISAVNVETGEVRPVIRAPGIDQGPIPSPDGRRIVFHRAPGPPYYFTRQYHLAVAPTAGGEPVLISGEMRDEASLLGWHPAGILFRMHTGVITPVHRIDPDTRAVSVVTPTAARVHNASISNDGRAIAYVDESAVTAREAYLQAADGGVRRLTDMTAVSAAWPVHDTRLVRWKTTDGTEIEGVLYTSRSAAASRGPRPLLVLAHGGPGIPYRPVRVHSEIYPIQYWLDRGAAILAPNYRGSGGYGDAFLAMNAGRLPEVYAEDILSGVQHLVDQGVADPARLGMMGFSAGGDAAAYLATHSNRFRAVSVGAGISNFHTDYMTNDQPLKLREYLGSPWENRALYWRISPVSALASATTPTLVQHGRHDGRVSPANALELFRGLRAHGVETQLVLYENAGHGFATPRDLLAAMEHNRLWFDAYVFGDGGRPDLSLSEAPVRP